MSARSFSARLASLVFALSLGLTACAGGERDEAREDPGSVDDADSSELDAPGKEPDEPDAQDEPDEAEEVDEPAEPEVDPAEVDADELGRVPVLMYHQLNEDGGSAFDMTPEEFRSELEYLFEAGYVPITTAELVRGEIDVPAGRSPVVLTFDDSTRSQAYLTDDGEIHPESSIGILIDVASAYEEVEPVASVYVISSSLFGGRADGEEILAALHEAGMEIGNHTHTHSGLKSLDASGVQKELATNIEAVRSVIPEAELATLSLPLGQYPQDERLAVSGEWQGTAYEHEGVLMVGYDPAPSPFDAAFDAAAVPRIQTNVDPDFEFGSAWWLEVLEHGQSTRRYISDGDPQRISFPEEFEDELGGPFADRANPY